MKRRKIALEIIAVLLILLFAYTGFSKLSEHGQFEYQLGKSPWTFLAGIAPLMSWIVPIGELIIVLLLTIPRTRLIGFYLSFITMVTFSIYIGAMLLSGVELPCSCGGVIKYMNWNEHLVFNIAYALLALAGILVQRRSTTMGIVGAIRHREIAIRH